MANFIQEVITSIELKAFTLALAIFFLGKYLFLSESPDIKLTVFFLISGIASSFAYAKFIKNIFNFPEMINSLIFGFGAYFTFIFTLLFFKISSISPVWMTEIKTGIIFGIITVGSSWVIKKYME